MKHWVEIFVQDVRYTLRMMGRNPGFTAVAALSLALGIGANTAIFSLVDTVLLKWLPVRAPQELVVLARNPLEPRAGFNYPDYRYVRDHNQVFSGVAAWGEGFTLGMSVPEEHSRGETELVKSCLVSGNYFDVLGVKPALGRLLTPDDNGAEGAHPVAALSYNFWRKRFGADPRAVGMHMQLNGSAFTIVGVSQRGFSGTAVGTPADVFIPIVMLKSVDRSVRDWDTRHFWWLRVLARLKPGVNIRQATAAAEVLFDQIEKNDPERRPAPSFNKDRDAKNRAVLLPGSAGYSYLRNRISKPLGVLSIVVGLVLLIACANVANLLLARAAARQKEIAIRVAIGASRLRLAAQLLTETVVLSVLGGAAGLLLAYWGAQGLIMLLPRRAVPIELDLSPDLRLVAFSFGVSLLTGIVAGLAPAWKSTRPDLTPTLKSEGGFSAGVLSKLGLGRMDLRKALVTMQVALCLLLLVGAGLFVKTLGNLRELNPGFERENLLFVEVNPSQIGYKGQRLRAFYERLEAAVRTMPGVESASLAAITPLQGRRWNSDVTIQGYQWKPKEEPFIDMNAVGPGFFRTLGIPILLGRDFRPEDNTAFTPDPPDRGRRLPPEALAGGPPRVAIINETMAKRFFPNESPLGKRLTLDEKFKMDESFVVEGVVKDAKYFGLRDKAESMIYIPVWRLGADARTLCVRASGDPANLLGAIRRQVRSQDAAAPVLGALTMEQQMDNDIAQERIVAILCSFFGALALLLASVGLYGILAQSVARRTREIGIRMALGARRKAVLWLVLRDALLLVGVGAAIGIPCAFGLTRFVASFLYGLTPHDPLVMAGSAALLGAVTIVAAYLPARRATKVDPMTALRHD